jgi:hypothetical protein
MISEAAYYRSQKPEFAQQSVLDHWLAAEDEIKVFLAGVSTGAVSMPTPPRTKTGAIERPARKPGPSKPQVTAE